jgi:fumarylpyruvate hydrolase
MSVYVLPPPPIVAVPVEGETAAFPVRRIFCVGRNYAAHRREMGGDDREPPCFFTKPADAAIGPGHDIPYPPATGDLHHEIELVVALSGGGANVSTERALDLVFGYAAGVDLTRRDLQNDAKDKRQPWDSSKAFDFSAPVSAIRKWSDATPVGRIALSVNGEARQDAKLTDMMWSVHDIIAEASKLWTLAPGDLIFTGTPEGVGPIKPGDVVRGEIEGVGVVEFRVTGR